MPNIDPVEEQIQAAIARGEFDDLPGSGSRLDLGMDDANWWARRKLREMRESDELEARTRELDGQLDRLWVLTDEQSVRARVIELNRHIAELNEGVPESDRIPAVDPVTAIRTWRSMHRLRLR